ncbi:unnamed protein product, partial [Mesorhabditis belari]|uniref:Uncharacterized protein n=1 Tax=Mesorhabditis belari TaxID=2138241 RepID=A0AAF3FQ76_9BILA
MEIDRRVKLETLVATEKRAAKKATQKLELKEAELLQVRSMLHDVNETKSENKVLKQQPEASDFDEDLFRRSKPVQALVAYINMLHDFNETKIENKILTQQLEASEFYERKMTQELEMKNKRISEIEITVKNAIDRLSAVKTKNVSKSGSDGLGGSIHGLGDRALTRIENAPSSSSSVLGRSSLPLQSFASKRPAPVQSISEVPKAKKRVTFFSAAEFLD